MSRPTMEDVKNLAGVSISTVSRVINGTKKVSPEKTIAVQKAIEQLGYKPNEVARSLVMKRSNTIGIIIDDLDIEYMAQIVRGIDEVGKMYKYDILLYSTFGDIEVQKKAVEFLSSKQVEGIIIISENISSEIIFNVKELEIPYVLLDHYYDNRKINTISIDYDVAMSELTKIYTERGHKNILYLREKSQSYSAQLKENGYEKVILENGLNKHAFSIDEVSVEAANKFMYENIGYINKNKISAIMTSDDRLAIGVMHYFYENKKSEKDICVSGFGNYEISRLYRPTITTIKLPYYDMGAISIRMLIKVLKEEEKFDKTINLNYEIMLRESTQDI